METESKHATTNLKKLGTFFKMRPLRDVAPWRIPPPSLPSLRPSILTICKPLNFSDAPVLDSIVKVLTLLIAGFASLNVHPVFTQ